ncbi:MAG: hypothetical protein JSS95_03820 [Acidobacteria bacterium]|nr:hypothetical protein [Acidobacteriota bacterium]
MKKVISSDHDVINIPISLISDENFLKLTSRPIDLLFALAHKKNGSVQSLADRLGMRVVNVYRERTRLKEAGFIYLKEGKARVSFPLDFEIPGTFSLPCFLVDERLSTEEWKLMLALYRVAHEMNSARLTIRSNDLCAFSGVSVKNLARVRRELVSKGLLLCSKAEYSLRNPITQEGVDQVFGLEA